MAIESRNKRSVNFAMSGMTDIVFLLLIFFMLTSTFVVPTASKVQLPESDNRTQASPIVTVSITEDKELLIADQIYDNLDEIEQVLIATLEGKGTEHTPPYFKLNADKNLHMKEVFDILAIARNNKFGVILGTKPKK